MPTVVIGGVSLLTLLIRDPAYVANPLRQALWRAGHAHAAVLLVAGMLTLGVGLMRRQRGGGGGARVAGQGGVPP